MARKEQTLGDSIEQYSYGRAGIPTGSGMGNSAGLEAWQRGLQRGGSSPAANSGGPGELLGTLAFFGALFYFAATSSGNLLQVFLYAFGIGAAVGCSVSLILRTRIGRLLIKTVLLMIAMACLAVMAALIAG